MSSMQNAPGHILDPLPLMHKRGPVRATIALHAIVCIRDFALIGADLVRNETIARRRKRYSARRPRVKRRSIADRVQIGRTSTSIRSLAGCDYSFCNGRVANADNRRR